jgi:TonB family protein
MSKMSNFKSHPLIVSLSIIGLLALTCARDATAFASTLLLNQDEKAVWERYTTVGEEFSVLMPELPGVIQRLECLDIDCHVKRIDNTYAAYSNGVVYLVTSYQTPRGPSLEEIISERMSPALIDSSDTVKSEVKLNKFKGKKYIYPAQAYGYDILTAFYLTDEHVYEITAVGGSRKDSAIQKFFKSFELGSKKGKEIGNGARTGAESLAAPASPKKETQSSQGNPPANIFKPNEVTRKAIIITKPAPAYTEEARKNLLTGTVTLQMVFAASGRVTNIRTVSGLQHGLTEKAIEAARKIYFLPAVKDGKRVSQYIRVEYNFNIY